MGVRRKAQHALATRAQRPPAARRLSRQLPQQIRDRMCGFNNAQVVVMWNASGSRSRQAPRENPVVGQFGAAEVAGSGGQRS